MSADAESAAREAPQTQPTAKPRRNRKPRPAKSRAKAAAPGAEGEPTEEAPVAEGLERVEVDERLLQSKDENTAERDKDLVDEEWRRLRKAIDAACAELNKNGGAGGNKKAAGALRLAAEKFDRNADFLLRRMMRICAADRQRMRTLEGENDDLLERVILLRQKVPAPLRRPQLRCRADPLIFSSYSIDKMRHVARSGDNTTPQGAGGVHITNPISGRSVEKSRYQKKIKPVVLNAPEPGAGGAGVRQ